MTTLAQEPEVIVREEMLASRAVDRYLGDLSRRGRRPKALITYGRHLDKFVETLPEDCDVQKVTTDHVRRYLDKYLTHSRGTQAQVFSILKCFFDWLYREDLVKRSPMARLLAPRRLPQEALDVTTISTEDARRLLAAASGWTEKLSVAVPLYTGARRHAVAQLRVEDYDQARRLLRFSEKGGKTIWKPAPDELASLLAARLKEVGSVSDDHTRVRSEGSEPALGQGQGRRAPLISLDDYLIPGEAPIRTGGDRDDRLIWHAVKRAARRAGLNPNKVHVHALRAAFAVAYLETNPGDMEALQTLMGHRSIATTEVYVRRLDRELAMERVRGMSWSA